MPLRILAIIALLTALPRHASAYRQATTGKVLTVSCNHYSGYGASIDNVCTVTLSVPVPGYAGCLNMTDLVFDASTAPGKSVLSLATAALLSGKNVLVDVMRCSPVSVLASYPELRSLDLRQ